MDRGDTQRAVIATVAADLDRAGVRYWLMGGWAVDSHVGRVTRPHSDIDFAVYEDDRPQLVAVVAQHGYISETRTGPAGEVFVGGPALLEITYLMWTPGGDVVTPGFEGWPYPPGAFDDTRIEINGVPVPVISVEALLETKEGWQRHLGEPLRDHDRADIDALRQLRPDLP